MTKSTSTKSTALSLITKKMHSERQLHKPGPFYEKSPEHERSPSSLSEEEETSKKLRKKPDKYEVSRELSLDSEADEQNQNAGEQNWTNKEKATKPDSTAEVSKKANTITLDELLQQVGVSERERRTIKNDLSLWHPKDLKHLAPAEIVTDPQYCSCSARQALYTISAQLSDSGDSDE